MSDKAAVKKVSEKTVAEKASEKRVEEKVGPKVIEKRQVMEKRRALGRGLESLLPMPQRAKSGLVSTPGTAVAPSEEAELRSAGQPGAGAGLGRAGMPVAPSANADEAHRASGGTGPSPVPTRPAGPIDGRAGIHHPVAAEAGVPGAPAPAPQGPAAVDLQAEEEIGEGVGPEYPPSAEGPATGDGVAWLAIDCIERNPHQTRMNFLIAMEELTDSIRTQGVLQPIVVRPRNDGRYTLILGERRLRAAQEAGLEKVPALVKRVSEQQAAEMTLVENMQRQDLNCVEQAEAFRRLSAEFKLTQEEIGARVGVKRQTVANYMRLLSLPEGVLEALVRGRLTFSHARTLMQLADNVQIWSFAKKAIDEGLSVARLEELVTGVVRRSGYDEEKKKGGGARWVDPNVKAAQRTLEEILGMRVRIRDRAGRGRIVIEYATIDDFERVVGMLGGK